MKNAKYVPFLCFLMLDALLVSCVDFDKVDVTVLGRIDPAF